MITEKLIQDTSVIKLFELLDDTTGQLLQLISSSNENKINTIPFENSWTAAQLVSHITKSNKAIAQALNMEGKTAERDPGERAHELEEIFLDFTIKFQSPEFILPTESIYPKEALIINLKRSIEQLEERRSKVNLSEMISVPPFGEITKLELLYFVLYHTQRHIHQLTDILKKLKKVKNGN